MFIFQRECMKKCLGEHPTLPGKLADEENDPRHHHRPSLSPDVVSSVCFISLLIRS